jgi:hypothetical protein
MEISRLGERQGILVPNRSGCTNFGAIALDGHRLFALKTAQSNKKSALMIYQSYKSDANCTVRTYTNQMGHGSGMTLADGKLYIAPMDKYIQILDTQHGMKRKKVKSPIVIASIAHVRDDFFMCGLTLVRITDSAVEIVKRYALDWDESEFPVGQDIGYRGEHLYFVRSSKTKNSNAIVRVPFERRADTLRPDRIYLSEKHTDLYELESIDFAGKTMVFAANMAGGKDCIFTAKI